jgi:hypothetical protein
VPVAPPVDGAEDVSVTVVPNASEEVTSALMMSVLRFMTSLLGKPFEAALYSI